MKCCSMKLANRIEIQQFLLKRKESHCHSMILGDGDNCSRFELSNKSNCEKDDPPQLTVLNISLPRDAKAFNTGSSLQRWTNKRPRLKSARNSAKSENSNTYTMDVSILIEEFCNEYHLEETTDDILSTNDSSEQIHPDIRQLLEVTHKEPDEASEKTITKIAKRNSKQRHKKKKKKSLEEVKEIKEPKKMVTKTVSFSLSKPPTPQTEQVIRVDIVSNYSVDIEISENCSKRKNVNKQEQAPKMEKDALIELLSESNKRAAKNLVVESKKVVLYQRDMDSNKNV